MKKRILLLCVLALSASPLLIGQSEDQESVQAELKRAQAEVEKQMSEAAAQVKEAQAEAASQVREAQAGVAEALAAQSEALSEARESMLAAVAETSERPEAPEPPEPPEPVEPADVFGNAGGPGGFALSLNDGMERVGGASMPLIVASGPVEEPKLAEIQEDLAVMSRILGKAVERTVGRERARTAMNITVFGQSTSRLPQSEFIDGFGVLFHLNVRFPLVPPPAKEEVRKEKTDDTTWEKTKRELYGPGQARGAGMSAELLARYGLRTESASAPYDAEQVESLKKALVESLKNASNIRNVAPSETVAVAVQGAGSAAGVRRVHTKTLSTGNKPREEQVIVSSAGGGGSSRQSVLTLRVTKSDADDYAKGKVSFEEFSRKVQVRAY